MRNKNSDCQVTLSLIKDVGDKVRKLSTTMNDKSLFLSTTSHWWGDNFAERFPVFKLWPTIRLLCCFIVAIVYGEREWAQHDWNSFFIPHKCRIFSALIFVHLSMRNVRVKLVMWPSIMSCLYSSFIEAFSNVVSDEAAHKTLTLLSFIHFAQTLQLQHSTLTL